MSLIFSPLARQKWVVLIEVIVLIVIVSLALTAGFNVIARWRNLATVSENRIKAINLAREGIEIATNIRDTNWKKFSSSYSTCWNVEDYNSECANGGIYTTLSGTYIPLANTGNVVWKLVGTGADLIADMENFRVYLGPTGIEQGVVGSYPNCNRGSIPLGNEFCRLPMFRDITFYPDTPDRMEVRVRVVYFDPPANKMTTITLNKTLTNWAKNVR